MSQKILVVEDELFMLRLIQHTLSKAGYELIEARTSEEARAAIKEQRPTLVVGDSKVVENSLRSDDSTPPPDSVRTIPVIRMSNEPSASSGGSDDCQVVFTRPFSPMKLVAEVKRLSSNATAPGGNL
ncbi:MAG: hypothetical protein ACK4UN_04470 [Limisphaerales bacterium]